MLYVVFDLIVQWLPNQLPFTNYESPQNNEKCIKLF